LKGQSLNLLSDQKGYVVTRMFRRKIVDQDENMVFIVVEKVSAKFLERYKSQFTMPQAIQTRHTYIV
jgi:ribosomal protein L22